MIELLVVISILSLLSSIVLASLNGARAKARDAHRVQTIKEIEKALHLYFSDKGFYPKADFAFKAAKSCGESAAWPAFETAISPYIGINWDELCLFGPNGTLLMYDSDVNDGYQTYGILIHPAESSVLQSLAQNDGGWLSFVYEIGEQPSYCKIKYNGFWGATGGTVCAGGD